MARVKLVFQNNVFQDKAFQEETGRYTIQRTFQNDVFQDDSFQDNSWGLPPFQRDVFQGINNDFTVFQDTVFQENAFNESTYTIDGVFHIDYYLFKFASESIGVSGMGMHRSALVEFINESIKVGKSVINIFQEAVFAFPFQHVSEAFRVTGLAAKLINENIGVSSVKSHIKGFIKLITENVGISSVRLRARTFLHLINESIGVSSVRSYVLLILQNINESISLFDRGLQGFQHTACRLRPFHHLTKMDSLFLYRKVKVVRIFCFLSLISTAV